MRTKQFKAESKKLLDLMINSIYTHKEIFLRELISNASDAVDKLYFRSLTDQNVGMSHGDFEIRITPDKENRTLTISDNGIGMTKEELEANLGTIAKSGSLAFKQENADAYADKAAEPSSFGDERDRARHDDEQRHPDRVRGRDEFSPHVRCPPPGALPPFRH